MKAAIVMFLFASLPTMAWAQADLSVELAANYNVDGNVRVSAEVVNAGPDDVTQLDLALAFMDASVVELEPECSESAVGAGCSLGGLETVVIAAGDSRVVEFLLSPSAMASSAVATVQTTATDPDEANNTDDVPLMAPTTVDVGVDERGLDDGTRKTLVFTATNAGPDTAADVRISGTITVDFDDDQDQAGARMLTGMNSDELANCGRQVPDSQGSFGRWTFPVSCSVSDLGVTDEVHFDFWFEGGSNALFRLTATSANFDENPSNDVTDGDFLNSPIEIVAAVDEGCCATSGATDGRLGLVSLAVIWGVRRRIRSRT